LKAEIFREYDIRGNALQELDSETVSRIGKAFGSIAIEKNCNEIAIGMDNRQSSEPITKTLIEAIISTGCNVTFIGTVPIPALYFSIIHLKKKGGIMVTGSHLPKEFNGFKLSYSEDASTLYGPQIQELRKRAESGHFISGNGRLQKADILSEYIDAIASRITLSRPLRIAIDCGNGTASLVATELFERIGCKVLPLFCKLDSSFPNHHPDPAKKENLSALASSVKANNADLGIAFDGDADRLGVIDEKGNILWGDTLLALFSRHVLQENPGAKIIFEVKCSQAVADVIRANHGIPVMYKAGHSLIKKKMKEENALLAGEMSGHMFFRDNYFGFDDALFAGARLCELVSETTKRLSGLVSEIPKYFSTPEIRLNVSEKEKWRIVEMAKNYFSGLHRVIEIDGARIEFEQGWALVRASNTSAAISLRMESKTEKGLREIKETMRSFLKTANPSLNVDF